MRTRMGYLLVWGALCLGAGGCALQMGARAPDEETYERGRSADLEYVRARLAADDPEAALARLEGLEREMGADHEMVSLYLQALPAWANRVVAEGDAADGATVSRVRAARQRSTDLRGVDAAPAELVALANEVVAAWATAQMTGQDPETQLSVARTALSLVEEPSAELIEVIGAGYRAWFEAQIAEEVDGEMTRLRKLLGLRETARELHEVVRDDAGIEALVQSAISEHVEVMRGQAQAMIDAGDFREALWSLRQIAVLTDDPSDTELAESQAAQIAASANERAASAQTPREKLFWELTAAFASKDDEAWRSRRDTLRSAIPTTSWEEGRVGSCELASPMGDVAVGLNRATTGAKSSVPGSVVYDVTGTYERCEMRAVKVGEEPVMESYQVEVPYTETESGLVEETVMEMRQCEDVSRPCPSCAPVRKVWACKKPVKKSRYVEREVQKVRIETRERQVGMRDVFEDQPFWTLRLTIESRQHGARRDVRVDQSSEVANEVATVMREMVEPWRKARLAAAEEAAAAGNLDEALGQAWAVAKFGWPELPWLRSWLGADPTFVRWIADNEKAPSRLANMESSGSTLEALALPDAAPFAHEEGLPAPTLGDESLEWALQAAKYREDSDRREGGYRDGRKVLLSGLRLSAEHRRVPVPGGEGISYFGLQGRGGPEVGDDEWRGGFVFDLAYGHHALPQADSSYLELAFTLRRILGEQFFVGAGLELSRAQRSYNETMSLRHSTFGILFDAHWAPLNLFVVTLEGMFNLYFRRPDKTRIDEATGLLVGALRGHRVGGRITVPFLWILYARGGVDYYTVGDGGLLPAFELGFEFL